MNTSTGSNVSSELAAAAAAVVFKAEDSVGLGLTGVQTFITRQPSSTPYVSLSLKYCRQAGPNPVPSKGSEAYGLEPHATGLHNGERVKKEKKKRDGLLS